MNRSRLIAAIVTAAIAIILLVLLLWCRLVFDPSTLRQPPRPMTELVEVDEEFVELLDQATVPSDPAPAYAEAPTVNESHAAEASGSDLVDAGAVGAPEPDVTTERPAPLHRKKKEKPAKTGPSKQELEEEARRRARKGVSDAFASAPEAQDNTDKHGRESGDSGKPEGQSSALDGTGTGSVGGGWIMPRYAKVNSTVTGRIELRAVVGKDGHVVSVEQTGGKAPAAANSALVKRCIAEVRSRRFTRNDTDAPDQAIARIVYTFK